MNGNNLKKAVAASDLTAIEVAHHFGISRAQLYNLYRSEDIGEQYKKKAKEIGLDLNTNQLIPVNAVPFYNIHATAGQVILPNQDTKEIPAGFIDLPAFRDCDFALPVRGNSMANYITHGDIIVCKRYDHSGYISFGNTFVIVTRQECMVKYVRKGRDEKHVVLASEHKDFDPFEIKISDILHLHLVKGVIKLTTF